MYEIVKRYSVVRQKYNQKVLKNFNKGLIGMAKADYEM